MQVKRLFVTITVLFNLLLPISAQAQQQERPIVRLIYFLPSDRESQPDIDEKMDKLIKTAQQYYADQMEIHGFGRKTFLFETDATGKAVVHHVVGRFTDSYYRNLSYTWDIWGEIEERFDTSKNFYLTAIDVSSGALDRGKTGGRGGDRGGAAGKALIPASGSNFTGSNFNYAIALHELGHAFGLLPHDFRPTSNYFCYYEWLDVHRAFNPSQSAVDQPSTIKMLPPSLASPPNAIRLRFEVTDPDGLHQVQLITTEVGKHISGVVGGEFRTSGGLLGCKRLNREPNRTIEFVTIELIPENKFVSLRMIDVHGNISGSQRYPIDITSLLPSPEVVSIPDLNLAAAVRREIGNITTRSMLNLTHLYVPNRQITNLTGLEHAHRLAFIDLGAEYVDGEGWVNSNTVSDFSPLEGLTRLTYLSFPFNSLVDVSSLADLTSLRRLVLWHNTISDVSPLASLTQLMALQLDGNTISDVSPLSSLTQLEFLALDDGNAISDVSALSGLTRLKRLHLSYNAITDVSPLTSLTQLMELQLASNTISDVSPLSGLTQLTVLDLRNNAILDVSPLVGLDLIGTDFDSIGLYLQHNPLSYASIHTHIPAMQAKGIEVQFDPRIPTTLTKRLGDAQQGKPDEVLAAPFVVEVRDEKGGPFAGVPIRFTVTAGGGKLRTTTTTTDATGRAQTTLTLGPNLITNTVRVTATEIQEPVIFTATATANPPPTFRKPTTFSVSENTTAVGAVKATDADKQDSVTGYAISPTAGEDSAKFSITPTGVLRFKTPPDYERPTTASRINEYIVLVSATGGTGKRARTGTQPFIITVTDVDEPPVAPAAPTVIPASPTSLIVSWAAPTNMGPPMTYEVRYRAGNTGRFTTANYNGARTNFTLKGLTQGKRYQVQVRAKNDEGRSAWSPWSIGIPQASPPINFPDAVLRAKIAEALGKASNATITAVDMLALAKLEAPNANIQNLAGIEHAHNLTTLSLGGEWVSGEGYVNSNAVSNFSPLFGLTQLTRLNLSGNSLSDLSALADLTNLTWLEFYNSSLSDLSALAGLTNLIRLNLSGNSISDVSPLAGLAQLTWLYLGGNNISDISVVAGLTNLTGLYLENNPISDVSALAGLAQLTTLYLANNSISDVSALAGLTQLTTLYLANNPISDVSALAGLTQLTWLYLANNPISDVSALAGLTQLTTLHLANNPISDVSALAGLTKLTYLHLSNTSISDISALAGLTKLTYLHLSNTSISDISALAGLTQLTYLYLWGNAISDVSPLLGLNLTGTQWDSTGLYLQGNPLSYASIHTHIPAIQAKGIEVKFDNRTPTKLVKISEAEQQATVNAALPHPFVVEVRDERNRVFSGVPVTFAVTAGGGTLSVTNTTTDENGRAESTLTLGPNPGTNTVEVSAAGIKPPVTFNTVPAAYLLPVPAGISLIHVPLKVTAVGGVAKPITSISDLYDALGGADTVHLLGTRDPKTQRWFSYADASDKGTSDDPPLTDDKGIIASMKTPVEVRLHGDALGTNGHSSITLFPGLNLVGVPLKDSRIARVSDLFALEGIGGNVSAITVSANGRLKTVRQAGDEGDIPITGGQSFILRVQEATTVAISGSGWYNTSAMAASSPVAMMGIEVGDTTPILAVRGSIVDEGTSINKADFRVIVKNLSTGRAVSTVIGNEDSLQSKVGLNSNLSEGVRYRLTVVDTETGRAARMGDRLEISAQSPNPLIGVQPFQQVVTAEDVKRNRIQLADLVAYEIPTETVLLTNYPNPFNPETWIPYRLAEDAFVTLTIYDLSGQAIRTLDVGHRNAAVYESRSKAVYWDGRNGFGEQVASGVYFYTLTAGDYSTTRKMVILK